MIAFIISLIILAIVVDIFGTPNDGTEL